ncbi:MAG: diguanylate cyclase [Leptolyngbyaceae cyanobacterium MAG.088]|nr:diguanylate cyclase [Leptolyngbyaceae cyanobacterium MAG.088]
MSLASQQSSQPLITSVFLDGHSSHRALSQALLELNQCGAIYQGDLDGAVTDITYSVVKNLGVTNCQIWLYADNRRTFKPVAQYEAMATETLPQVINVADYDDYFQDLGQRQWLVVNTDDSNSSTNSFGNEDDLSNRDLARLPPYLQEQAQSITAFIEIPIYHDQQIAGILCCTQHHTPRVWQSVETTFMITAACFVALVISHASQQQATKAIDKYKRKLSLKEIERQQAEQAWQESQRFIQGLLDASTNILYVNNFVNGANYYVNSYMKTILGYSPYDIQQFGAQFLKQITHPDDIQNLHQARQQLAQSSNGDIIENEYRLHHKKGGWCWMLCRETVFQWNQDGTPLQIFGTATDITERKRNEADLQQKNQVLTELAMIDGLTQIANRRAFDDFINRAWADRTSAPLSLILCDIDCFKLYNDNYGHQKGDTCIQRIAQTLKEAVKRRPDLVARYGGEEFAIILPNTTTEGAKHVAENVKTAIQELEIEHHYSIVGRYITLSLGIATAMLRNEPSPHELIAAADRGLYRAKSNGRAQFAVGYINSDDA